MWNAPNQPIPESQIRSEHLRVLKDAIDLEHPDTPEVRASLLYLERTALRRGGFLNYRRWLCGEGEAHYHAGLKAIHKLYMP